MSLPGALRTAFSRAGAVVLFFASVVPMTIEHGGFPLAPGALSWLRALNLLFAGMLAGTEFLRFHRLGWKREALKEEAVDAALLGGALLVAAGELLTGGAFLGLKGLEALIGPSKAFILGNLVLRIVRLFRFVGRSHWSYPKVFAGSFLLLIGAGALVLWGFPGAVKPGREVSFVDALFTSVSAVCVTGLVVVDTGTTWSPFGLTVILILIQVGGLGLMTFAAFFAMALGKGIGFTDRLVLREMMNVDPLHTLGRVLAGAVTATFACEAVGAAVMFGRFPDPADPARLLPPAQQAWFAVFHSVSAFCNAGFGLYPDNWMPFAGDDVMSVTVMALVVIGGLGFTVILNLLGLSRGLVHWVRGRLRTRPLTEEEEIEEDRREPARISLQTRVVLVLTAVLILGGAIVVWILEHRNALEGMSTADKVLASLFQSVTARTAGFNSVDTARLQPATLYFLMFLMFVGASPGGTGGGIKTVTAAVLLRTVTSMARGRTEVEMTRRSLPPEVPRQAIVVVTLSFLALFLGSLFLSLTETRIITGDLRLLTQGGEQSVSHPFLAILFEAVSAFGTVGLSAGFTGGLTGWISDVGLVILMVLMFLGRIGPLVLVLAMGRGRPAPVEFPEERVMIG